MSLTRCPLPESVTQLYGSSESFVVAQGLGNDPISGCFKAIGKTDVETGDIKNWTESIQDFVSLISTPKTLKLINQ